MAKFCSNCGHQLQDGGKFCSECGAAVGAPGFAAPPPLPPPPGHAPPGPPAYMPTQAAAYETCEIKWRRTVSWPIYKFVFFGEAIGPSGMYNAGQSKAVSNLKSPISFGSSSHMGAMQKHVQELVMLLTSQGWEPVPERGIAWWNYRFRRLLRA